MHPSLLRLKMFRINIIYLNNNFPDSGFRFRFRFRFRILCFPDAPRNKHKSAPLSAVPRDDRFINLAKLEPKARALASLRLRGVFGVGESLTFLLATASLRADTMAY